MANKSIQLNVIGRILVIVIAIFCGLAAYFPIRWGLGHTIAQYTDSKEVAEYSTELAPSDSQTYSTLATLSEKSFLADDLQKAIEQSEKAVSLAPNDYRLWLNLGKMRERSGDAPGAAKALRKALELAPNYSAVHWSLGNSLLRNGNTDEAFVEIRKAVENDSTYANPAVQTAWQTFDGDVAQISQKIGDSIPIKAGLVAFLAGQKKFDEAYAFWKLVPDDKKNTLYKVQGEAFINSLLVAKKFREAFAVQSQIASEADNKYTVGNIFNGDFEKEVKTANASVFDWQISEAEQPLISLDGGQKHGGNRSLVFVFNSKTGQEFRTVQQLVVVESGKSYKLETFYRSDLDTPATVKWEVVDINDSKVLATTDVPINKSPAWSTLSATFTTLPTTQAVIIRLAKAPCKQTLCPITGKLWFDDFSLK